MNPKNLLKGDIFLKFFRSLLVFALSLVLLFSNLLNVSASQSNDPLYNDTISYTNETVFENPIENLNETEDRTVGRQEHTLIKRRAIDIIPLWLTVKKSPLVQWT
jgi:hypothetical protein